jgi:hypothetical protein
VNRSLVQQYFSNEDPVGRYFTPQFEYSGEPVFARAAHVDPMLTRRQQ